MRRLIEQCKRKTTGKEKRPAFILSAKDINKRERIRGERTRAQLTSAHCVIRQAQGSVGVEEGVLPGKGVWGFEEHKVLWVRVCCVRWCGRRMKINL